LAFRVAHLVREGADPQRLLLTFSRRAAVELERRAGNALRTLLDARSGQPLRCRGGHVPRVGARLLREELSG
jgi:DNA helicase-2/ATP-dependent DNA helicase PcrA